MNSNRRTTRASSRGTPSTRAPSPPVLSLHNTIAKEVNDTAAARKARGESLPTVVSHESTAYGGTGTVMPASIKQAGRVPLEKTLENMLEEEGEEEEEEAEFAPEPEVRSRRSKTPSNKRATPSRTVRSTSRATPTRITHSKAPKPVVASLASINEIVEPNPFGTRGSTPVFIYGRGSTFFDTPSALNAGAAIGTPNLSGTMSQMYRAPVRTSRAATSPPALNRQPSEAAPQPGDEEAPQPSQERLQLPLAPRPSFDQFCKKVLDNIIYPFISGVESAFSWFLANWLWALAFISCIAIVIGCPLIGNSLGVETSSPANSRAYHWYGMFDIKHNVGQFIPLPLTRPTTFLDADGMQTVANLLDRMRNVEYDIEYLKRQVSLDTKTIGILQKTLPDFIVSKKDKSGKLQIPQDFWNALKAKINEEPWGFTADSGSKKHPSNNEAKGMTPKLWDEWMKTNEAKIRSWNAEDLEQAYNNHIKASFKNDVLVSKSDLVKMLEDTFKSSKKDVSHEIEKLLAHIEMEVQSAKKEAMKASVSKDEINQLIADYLKKQLPKTQLAALAQANLNNNLKMSLSQVNHFSLKSGASIMAHLTSPDYNFAAKRASWLHRKVLSIMGIGFPSSNDPSTALRPWDEHGDCWCASGPIPNATSKAMTPQLAVMTSHDIYPDEIIIEHIPQSATLTPASTPREFEILARIADNYSLRPLYQQSLNLIPQNYAVEDNYIRIAKFRYDVEGPTAQAFPIQVRLGDFAGQKGLEFNTEEKVDVLKPYSRKFIIRALSNYGEDFTCLYRIRLHGEVAVGEITEDPVFIDEDLSSIEEDEII